MLHRIITDHKSINAANLSEMCDADFLTANNSFISELASRKPALMEDGILSSDDIDSYVKTFKQAQYYSTLPDIDAFHEYRKQTEKHVARICDIISTVSSQQISQLCDELDSFALETMQKTTCFTDDEWEERYSGVGAQVESTVKKSRKGCMDYVELPNPFTREMIDTWHIPDSYDDKEQEKALKPWASHLVVAMDMYKQGQYMEALGIGLDALDKLVLLCNCDEAFFYSYTGIKRYAAELIDVTLYAICKTYSAKELSADAKHEVCVRLDAYRDSYMKALSNNPASFGSSTGYSVEKLIREYRSSSYGELFNSFFHLADNKDEKSQKQVSLDEQETLKKKALEEVLSIQNYATLSTEELELLSHILINIYQEKRLFHVEMENGDMIEERLGRIGEELSARMKKATDLYEKALLFYVADNISMATMEAAGYEEFAKGFVSEVMSTSDVAYPLLHAALIALQSEPLTQVMWNEKGRSIQFSMGEDFFQNTIRQWASTQQTNGSWTDVSAVEAYGRICVIGTDFGSVKDVDNGYITNTAYDYYSKTPSQSPKQLYMQFKAYKTKWGKKNKDNDFIVQAIQILHSDSLMLADRLRLLYITLQ